MTSKMMVKKEYNFVIFLGMTLFLFHPTLSSAQEQKISNGNDIKFDRIVEESLDNIQKYRLGLQEETEIKSPLEQSHIDVLDVKDQSIREVIESISQKGNLDIRVDESVQGRVTIYLKDLKASDALAVVLETNGLAFKEEDGVYYVMPPDKFREKYSYGFGQQKQIKEVVIEHADILSLEEILNGMKSESGYIHFDKESHSFILEDSPGKVSDMTKFIRDFDVAKETKRFILKNHKASEIASSLQESLTQSVGRLDFEGDSQEIEVTDTVEKLKELEKVIQGLDQVKSQILIEVKILQIALDDEYLKGVDWEAIVSQYQKYYLGQINPDNGQRTYSDLSLGTVNEEDYKVLLDALEAVGEIATISNFKVITMDNNNASITIHSVETPVTENPEEIQKFAKKKEAVFHIATQTSEDDIYTVALKPVMVREGVNKNENSRNAYFEIDEHVESSVGDGETLVVGGMFKERVVEATRKVPLLGDLPLLGFAFRNQGERVLKTELVVFLTFKTLEQ